jgi:diketogulonate reductase-like aldo/keto reductase
MPNLIEESCGNGQLKKLFIEEVHQSLRKLSIKTLEGYLLHTPENFYHKGVMQGLRKAKQLGLVRNIGVSIYETGHALDVVSSGQ